MRPKPAHLVLAVLSLTFSLPCAHAHNRNVFLDHSYAKWLQATSGKLKPTPYIQDNIFLFQLDGANLHFTRTTGDKAGKLDNIFDYDYSNMAHSTYVPSITAVTSGFDVLWLLHMHLYLYRN